MTEVSKHACIHWSVFIPPQLKPKGFTVPAQHPVPQQRVEGVSASLWGTVLWTHNHFLLFPSPSIHFHHTVTTLLFFRHTWQHSRSFAITPPLRGCVFLRTWVSSKSIYTFGACVQPPVGRELHEDRDFGSLLWSLCPDSEWHLANVQ